MVHQYRSAGKHARIPPEDVLKVMRTAWRKKAMENLAQAIATIRAVGLDIDWTRLEMMLEGAAAGAWRRPGFLNGGLSAQPACGTAQAAI